MARILLWIILVQGVFGIKDEEKQQAFEAAATTKEATVVKAVQTEGRVCSIMERDGGSHKSSGINLKVDVGKCSMRTCTAFDMTNLVTKFIDKPVFTSTSSTGKFGKCACSTTLTGNQSRRGLIGFKSYPQRPCDEYSCWLKYANVVYAEKFPAGTTSRQIDNDLSSINNWDVKCVNGEASADGLQSVGELLEASPERRKVVQELMKDVEVVIETAELDDSTVPTVVDEDVIKTPADTIDETIPIPVVEVPEEQIETIKNGPSLFVEERVDDQGQALVAEKLPEVDCDAEQAAEMHFEGGSHEKLDQTLQGATRFLESVQLNIGHIHGYIMEIKEAAEKGLPIEKSIWSVTSAWGLSTPQEAKAVDPLQLMNLAKKAVDAQVAGDGLGGSDGPIRKLFLETATLSVAINFDDYFANLYHAVNDRFGFGATSDTCFVHRVAPIYANLRTAAKNMAEVNELVDEFNSNFIMKTGLIADPAKREALYLRFGEVNNLLAKTRYDLGLIKS